MAAYRTYEMDAGPVDYQKLNELIGIGRPEVATVNKVDQLEEQVLRLFKIQKRRNWLGSGYYRGRQPR